MTVINYPSTDKFQENSLYTGLAGKGTVKLNLEGIQPKENLTIS